MGLYFSLKIDFRVRFNFKIDFSKWIIYYEFMLEHALIMEGNNNTLIRVLKRNIQELKLKQFENEES